MYATAHRVRNQQGQEGINAFVHKHGNIPWPEMAWQMPEQQPGTIVQEKIDIPPGGNDVLAFLDVIAPDSCRRTQLEQTMRTLWLELVSSEMRPESLFEPVPNPVRYEQAGIILRFGTHLGFSSGRALTFAALWQQVSEILNKSQWAESP